MAPPITLPEGMDPDLIREHFRAQSDAEPARLPEGMDPELLHRHFSAPRQMVPQLPAGIDPDLIKQHFQAGPPTPTGAELGQAQDFYNLVPDYKLAQTLFTGLYRLGSGTSSLAAKMVGQGAAAQRIARRARALNAIHSAKIGSDVPADILPPVDAMFWEGMTSLAENMPVVMSLQGLGTKAMTTAFGLMAANSAYDETPDLPEGQRITHATIAGTLEALFMGLTGRYIDPGFERVFGKSGAKSLVASFRDGLRTGLKASGQAGLTGTKAVGAEFLEEGLTGVSQSINDKVFRKGLDSLTEDGIAKELWTTGLKSGIIGGFAAGNMMALHGAVNNFTRRPSAANLEHLGPAAEPLKKAYGTNRKARAEMAEDLENVQEAIRSGKVNNPTEAAKPEDIDVLVGTAIFDTETGEPLEMERTAVGDLATPQAPKKATPGQIKVAEDDPAVKAGEYQLHKDERVGGWSALPRGYEIPKFSTEEEAQAAIDAFEDKLVAKYGEQSARNVPLLTGTGGFAELPTEKTPLSDSEVFEMRALYVARGHAEAGLRESAVNSIVGQVGDGPLSGEDITEMVDKTYRSERINELMGHKTSQKDVTRAARDLFSDALHRTMPDDPIFKSDDFLLDTAMNLVRRGEGEQYRPLLRQVGEMIFAMTGRDIGATEGGAGLSQPPPQPGLPSPQAQQAESIPKVDERAQRQQRLGRHTATGALNTVQFLDDEEEFLNSGLSLYQFLRKKHNETGEEIITTPAKSPYFERDLSNEEAEFAAWLNSYDWDGLASLNLDVDVDFPIAAHYSLEPEEGKVQVNQDKVRQKAAELGIEFEGRNPLEVMQEIVSVTRQAKQQAAPQMTKRPAEVVGNFEDKAAKPEDIDVLVGTAIFDAKTGEPLEMERTTVGPEAPAEEALGPPEFPGGTPEQAGQPAAPDVILEQFKIPRDLGAAKQLDSEKPRKPLSDFVGEPMEGEDIEEINRAKLDADEANAIRARHGIPFVENRKETEAEAMRRIRENQDGEYARLMSEATEGKSLESNLDMTIMRFLVRKARVDGARDTKLADAATELQWAYQDKRSIVARMLGNAGDRSKKASLEDQADTIMEKIYNGSEKSQQTLHDLFKDMREAKRRGDPDKVKEIQGKIDAEKAKMAQDIREMLDYLKTHDVDLPNLERWLAENAFRYDNLLGTVHATYASGRSKLREYWKGSVLSGINMFGVDVLSSGTNSAWIVTGEPLFRGVIADIGRMIDPKSKQYAEEPSLRHIPGIYARILPGIVVGAKNAFVGMATETNPLQSLVDPLNQTSFAGWGESRALGGYGGKAFRLLTMGKIAFVDNWLQTIVWYSTRGMHADLLAVKKGMNRGTDEYNQFVADQLKNYRSESSFNALEEEARRATFQQKGAKVTRGIKRIMRQSRAIPFLGDYMTGTFPDTTANILEDMIRKSPLGIFSFAGDWHHAKRTGDWSRFNIQRVNQIVFWGLAYAMYDLVTPGDDEPPWIAGTEDEPYGAEGRVAPGGHLRFGGPNEKGEYVWHNFKQYPPFGTGLLQIVDLSNMVRTGKWQDAWKLISGPLDSFASLPMIRGSTDALIPLWHAAGGRFKVAGKGAANWASNFMASWVPKGAKEIVQAATKDSVPERRITGKDFQSYMNSWVKRTAQKTELPQLFNVSPDNMRYDRWGRRIEAGPYPGSPQTNLIYRMLLRDGVITKGFVGDDILRNWNSKVAESEDLTLKRYDPETPDYKVQFRSGAPAEYLTDEELEEFQRDSGRLAAQLIQEAHDAGRIGDPENPTEGAVNRVKALIRRADVIILRRVAKQRKAAKL